MATTPRTLRTGNVRDRAESRDTGITLTANGGGELAAAAGVEAWWDAVQIRAGRLQPGSTSGAW